MFAELEAGFGLDVVTALQPTANPLFNVLGGDPGYLLVLPLIFWSIDRKPGRRSKPAH